MKHFTLNGLIGGLLIAALLVVAAISLFWTPFDPMKLSFTARLAGPRLTADDIETLETLLQHHRASAGAGHSTEMTAANRAFHFHIYRAAGSAVLMSQIENLWLRSGPYVRFLSDRMGELLQTEHKAGFTDHHAAMLAATRARDWAALGAACEADIKASADLLMGILETEEAASKAS